MSTKAAPALAQARDIHDLEVVDSVQNQLSTAHPPVCDIYETEQNIFITAELPEVKKEDVFVSFEHNLLTLGGSRRNVELLRCFFLPGFVDIQKVSTEFKAGILRIIIRKRERVLPGKVKFKI